MTEVGPSSSWSNPYLELFWILSFPSHMCTNHFQREYRSKAAVCTIKSPMGSGRRSLDKFVSQSETGSSKSLIILFHKVIKICGSRWDCPTSSRGLCVKIVLWNSHLSVWCACCTWRMYADMVRSEVTALYYTTGHQHVIWAMISVSFLLSRHCSELGKILAWEAALFRPQSLTEEHSCDCQSWDHSCDQTTSVLSTASPLKLIRLPHLLLSTISPAKCKTECIFS